MSPSPLDFVFCDRANGAVITVSSYSSTLEKSSDGTSTTFHRNHPLADDVLRAFPNTHLPVCYCHRPQLRDTLSPLLWYMSFQTLIIILRSNIGHLCCIHVAAEPTPGSDYHNPPSPDMLRGMVGKMLSLCVATYGVGKFLNFEWQDIISNFFEATQLKGIDLPLQPQQLIILDGPLLNSLSLAYHLSCPRTS